MKKILTFLLAALLLLSALSLSAFAAEVGFIAYNKGNNANDGLSASTAKKTLGTLDGSGAVGMMKNGGILVISEKMYIGDNFTWKVNGETTWTANYGGVDHKNPAPASNPAAGVIKMKPGCTLTIASDVIIDDVIYFQEGSTDTFRVTNGATLTVTEAAVFMSKNGNYPQIVVDSGSSVVLEGGRFNSVTGDGSIKIGDKVTVGASAAPSTASGAVAFFSYAGNDANDGQSAATAKRGMGTTDGKGVANLLKKGGTLVVCGKGYIGNDYAWCVDGDTTVTAVYGGVDYRNPEPASNPASGAVKMKPGATLTVASNLTFDNVILFQENAQCTLLVTGGATLTVNENVTSMSNRDHFMKIYVAEGSTAIVNGGIFSSVSGPGTIKIGAKAKVLEEGPVIVEKEPAKRELTVCYLDYDKGSNENDGSGADKAVKSYASGVFSRILMGGTVVISGNSHIGGTGANNEYAMPLLVKPLTFTSVHGGNDYTESAKFYLSSNTTFVIASDVTFDNIVLVQDEQQNTIRVKRGATLTVSDTVKLVTEGGATKHYNVVLEEGALAILSAEAQKQFTVTGNGTVVTYVDGYTELLNQKLPMQTIVELTIGSKIAYINGEAQTLDAAPINRKNRTMLPVRFLANAFGIDNDGIHWDAATRTATLKNASVTISVTIDAPTMTVNGQSVALDSPAIIESNRTYLPVRAIANALGVSNDNIFWDGATSTATLIK